MAAAGLALAGLGTLAACSADTNPVRDVVAAVGAGPQVTPPPDFVARTRPGSLDYIPISTAAPGRPTPARSAAEVAAAQAELDSVRTANEAAAQAARQAGATSAPAAPVQLKPKTP